MLAYTTVTSQSSLGLHITVRSVTVVRVVACKCIAGRARSECTHRSGVHTAAEEQGNVLHSHSRRDLGFQCGSWDLVRAGMRGEQGGLR